MFPKSLPLFLLLLFISSCCLSQNKLVGTWEGKFFSTYSLGEPKLVVEIYDFKDSLFTGISHLYYEGNQYEHYKVVGRFYKKDSLLAIRESETIAVDLGNIGNCLGLYTMKLTITGNDMWLEGIWVSNKKGCSANTAVALHKKVPPIIPPVAPAKKKQEVKQPVAAIDPLRKKIAGTVATDAVVAQADRDNAGIKALPARVPLQISQRATDVQSLLEIAPLEKDSIKVEVYDNGEIDGDSVSVYEEHLLRINKQLITARPITFYVSLDKNVNPITHLRLVAESLGSIPPCTALMVVTTKLKRYEVRLSSNFKKNATLELFLKD